MEEYLKLDIRQLIKEKKIVYIEPKRDHYFTVVWLHGYGDTHLGFYELFQDNINPFGEHTKIVLPCAPLIKTKALPAFLMNSWFDIEHLQTQDLLQANDQNGIKNAAEFIQKIIQFEASILNNQYERIFLGGFSQGFMLSLKVGLEFEYRLGGVLGFCGINFNFNDKHRNRLPLFIGISKNDSVINFQLASQSFEELESNRQDYNFCLFVDQTSGHTISTQGYKKLEEFYSSLQSRYVQ
ncbi:hypothetical protein ABPG74_007139 [Tetrahymena malaccensis]